MDKKEFIRIRHYLGRTQNQAAQLLSVSTKAIQSFEQGWRKIPPHIERQTLFLRALKMGRKDEEFPDCWEMKKCPAETRERCPAWEFQEGHLCWFINGTTSRGKEMKSWAQKMQRCRKCSIFKRDLHL